MEEEYINNKNDLLFNIGRHSRGGDNLTNNPNRDSIIKSIGEASKRRWSNLTQEERNEYCISMRGENNPNYGNRGLKNPLFGKPLTNEHKRKISESLKGRKLSTEQIEKLRRINSNRTPWNKGKKLPPLSKDHKRKLSKALKGKNPLM